MLNTASMTENVKSVYMYQWQHSTNDNV